ncbi:MAG: YCF48-related protein, partial [Ignavibacteriae bacterium]|nr:YCF48-related protein [Ignavibacteriota bacterium]
EAPHIKRTTNGGTSWTDTTFGPGITSLRLEKLIGSTSAVAYYAGKILKTTNLGFTWNTINQNNPVTLSGMFVLDENNFFGADNNSFYISSNGGVNWVQKSFPEFIPPNSSKRMAFLNPTTGYIMSYINRIFYTTNAGDNWTAITDRMGGGSPATWLKDYSFINDNTGFVCGYNSTILKTTDTGNTWSYKVSPFTSHITGICFINANTGFACGGISGCQYIAKTTNTGENWNIIDSIGYNSLNKIRFFNASTGICTESYGKIFRTTDGGDNWAVFQSTLTYGIFGVFITNSSTGFIAGGLSNAEKKIFKTTDAGATWFEVFGGSGIYTGFYSLEFVNSSTGYCAGYELLKTTNSGANWFKINAPTSSFCTNIEVINDNTMYITSLGTVYKSTNA